MRSLGNINHTLTRWGRTLMRDNRMIVRGYFEYIYRNEDPYKTTVDPEGDQKRDDILRALAGRRFKRGLEIGSGEGTLALRYADQVDELILTDISSRALRRARQRLADKPHITTQQLDFVADALPGGFDLVVCQESLFYARRKDLPDVCDKILGALDDGGTLVLLHPRSIHDDDSGLEYKDIGAKTVHQVFIDDERTHVDLDETYEMYRITRMKKQRPQQEPV